MANDHVPERSPTVAIPTISHRGHPVGNTSVVLIRERDFEYFGYASREEFIVRDMAEDARGRAHGQMSKYGYGGDQKLKNGGHVKGKSSGSDKGKIGAVNIVVGKGGGGGEEDAAKEQMAAKMGQQQGLKAGMQLGARMAAQKLAGAGAGGPAGPPMMGAPPPHPPMAGPPPGIGAAGPPQMAKDGGKIRVRAHERRRGGGVCD